MPSRAQRPLGALSSDFADQRQAVVHQFRRARDTDEFLAEPREHRVVRTRRVPDEVRFVRFVPVAASENRDEPGERRVARKPQGQHREEVRVGRERRRGREVRGPNGRTYPLPPSKGCRPCG